MRRRRIRHVARARSGPCAACAPLRFAGHKGGQQACGFIALVGIIAGRQRSWLESTRFDSTRLESNQLNSTQLNSTQLESFAMKETMACLLGAPHGNQRCSDKVLRGRKRWRVLPWASQRLRGEKPLETRRCCWRQGDAASIGLVGRVHWPDAGGWPVQAAWATRLVQRRPWGYVACERVAASRPIGASLVLRNARQAVERTATSKKEFKEVAGPPGFEPG